MEVGRGKGRKVTVERQAGGRAMKRRASSGDKHKGDDGDRRAKNARVEREG